ncbi:MAG: excinuclease ABC subunit UvrC [Eubacteriales bacterium]
MQTAKDITEKLKLLPDSPGVYIMKDAFGNIIYVGKAVSLKNRVRQYFSSTIKDAKVSAMVDKVADFDYVMTASQKEALILECNLIKKHMPKYNILLKDDKHYPYIRIDLNENYPRVEVVRSIKEDGAKYFGPYTSAIVIRDVLDTLSRTFKMRQCKKDISKAQKRKERPCLNFAIGRCLAPCTGNVLKEEYDSIIDEIIDFLSGNGEGLLLKLSKEMEELSEKMEYERCARIRDKIEGVKMMMQKQQATTPHLSDKDVFAITSDEGSAVVQAFFIRSGKLNETASFNLTFLNEGEGEILSYFLLQYYISKAYIPREILVNKQIEDKEILTEWLSEKRGKRVYIKIPRLKEDKNLVDMAYKNASETLNIKLKHRQREYDKTIGAAKRLKAYLGLQDDITRIECYDISNIQGTDSVSSMVVFTNGKPDKKEYRHFKIKTVLGANDFASMQETIERRFLRLLKEGDRGNFSSRPDLIVVDGEKGS